MFALHHTNRYNEFGNKGYKSAIDFFKREEENGLSDNSHHINRGIALAKIATQGDVEADELVQSKL